MRMQTDLFGNVPQIVIDVHETTGKSMNSVKMLMQMLDKAKIHYAIEKIPIGDVLGPDGLAIERKTVGDLVNTLGGSSYGVPRLTKQIEGLLKYERPHILIENLLSIRRDPVNGCVYVPFKTRRSRGKPYVVTMERVSYIHPSSLDALIQSFRDRGIQVIEGFNAAHSAGLLFGTIFPQTKDAKENTQRLPTIRTRKGLDTMSGEQEFFIAGIPGVNVVRARNLLRKFGSPSDVVTRTEEWTKVGGIGPKTVAAARKMLFTKYVEDSHVGEEQKDAEEQKTS